MAITIAIQGNQLRMVEDSNDPRLSNIDDTNVSPSGDNVQIINTTSGVLYINRPFGDFTTPSGASAIIVADLIADLMSGAAGGGIQDVAIADPATAGEIATPKAASASTVELLPANANRTEAFIRNDGTGILYIVEGADATILSALKFLQDDIFKVTSTLVVSGIWTAPNGFARINQKTK